MTTDVLTTREGAAWPRQAAAGTGVDNALRVLLAVFLATVVVEGPLRWAAAVSGWPNLLYLRDAIPVGSLLVLVLQALVLHRWLDLSILLATAVLAMHALAGLVLGLAPFQVASGFKTFVYVLYGMAMWPLLHDRWGTVLRAAGVIWGVTLAGLALNYAIGPLPWEGMAYETAFGTVVTTWQWWLTEGTPRLSGFARVSFNAAMLLGISGLLAMVALRRPWLRVVVAALTFLGILATTSKGMLLAFPLAAAWLVPAAGGAVHARAGRWMVQALCAIGLALPITMVFLQAGVGLSAADWPELAYSAWERFTRVWPDAFELLPDGIAAWAGAGLGSIGTPQLYGFHPHRFNPGDSLAVYLLVTFGLAGAVYYLLPAVLLRRVMAGMDDGVARAWVALLAIAYGYGVSISMVEETFFVTSLGLAIGAAVRAWDNRRPPA